MDEIETSTSASKMSHPNKTQQRIFECLQINHEVVLGNLNSEGKALANI